MIAPDQSPPTTRPGFLATAKASGLFSIPELARMAADLPADAQTGADVARHWVAAGVLTPFQADRLLASRTDGFVLGQYVVLDQVGRSPVGRTYKARHRAMNRLVAIEVLAPALTKDPARRAAFQAEARSAARLAHPNVVTVLDCNQLGERIYRVLEFVDGTDLDRMVRKSGPLPVARACEFTRQAALGLAHAHERGVPHGCLTPANVLVGRPGGNGRADRLAVKVADFGLGRVVAPGQPNPAAGPDPTDFRAPEFQAPTPAADLYSLGGTLFYLLIGRPPGKHPAVETTRPEVPPQVAGLIRQLLADSPADRPSAASVAGLLEPFAEGIEVGRVDFNIPGTGTHPTGPAYLTGLTPQPPDRPVGAEPGDTCPWAEIDSPTLETAHAHTPVAIRTPRPQKAKLSSPAVVAAVATAALVGGLLVGVAIRAITG